jgi:hypothetical protein
MSEADAGAAACAARTRETVRDLLIGRFRSAPDTVRPVRLRAAAIRPFRVHAEGGRRPVRRRRSVSALHNRIRRAEPKEQRR